MTVSAAVVLDALGDETRRAIVERLSAGPLPVRVLADQLPVSRPAVSQHLRVLKEAGLVLMRVEGTRHVYALNPTGADAARDYLDRFWTTTLSRFAALARAQAAADGSRSAHDHDLGNGFDEEDIQR